MSFMLLGRRLAVFSQRGHVHKLLAMMLLIQTYIFNYVLFVYVFKFDESRFFLSFFYIFCFVLLILCNLVRSEPLIQSASASHFLQKKQTARLCTNQ